MVSSKDTEPPAFQTFETRDGKPPQQLPVHFCSETGDLCIFWEDVQNTFHSVDYVDYMPRDWDSAKRVLFMVDSHGDLLRPLRIRSRDQFTYKVNHRKHFDKRDLAKEFEYLYLSWIGVFMEMEMSARTIPRVEFLELSGNAAYLHSKLMEQLQLLNEAGVKADVNEKTEDQILREIQDYQHEAPELDYQNACSNFLSREDILEPCRFLILPDDLDSCEDSDTATHQFRLYFLCDIITSEPLETDLPQHMHLSNHPGYKLSRPQQFFQVFGGYSLLMLKMVKRGLSYDHIPSKVPALDTLEILWSLDHNVAWNHLTKDNIGPLIAKSISYLETIPVPKCGSEAWLEGWECTTIKDYLVIPEGSNSLGGLYRCTTPDYSWYWTCRQHGQQSLPPGALGALENFVQKRSGRFNAQRASLCIELCSREDGEEFCTLLKNTGQRMDVSIKLGWSMSRRDLKDFITSIKITNVSHLELDGVTESIHPRGYIDYRSDLFRDHAEIGRRIGSVTLLHYPRPQEQYTYFTSWLTSAVYWVHWKKKQQGAETGHWWMNLLERMADDFVKAVVGNPRERDPKAVRRLQEFLAKAGCETVCSIGSNRNSWCGELDLQEGSLLKFQVYEFTAVARKGYDMSKVLHVSLEALESVSVLAVDVSGPDVDQEEITYMVQRCLQLQELDILQQERHALERLEMILELWQGRSKPLQVTLMERETQGRGRIVLKAVVDGHIDCGPGTGTLGIEGSNIGHAKFQNQMLSMPPKIKILQWHIDHFSTALTDQTAALLNRAVEHSPLAITLFSLDISLLSIQGLPHVQNILKNSALEFLHIHCTTLDYGLIDSVRQILIHAQWSTLQSLELTGVAVNEWIELLAAISVGNSAVITPLRDLQLQHFGIYGTSADQIDLTHSSLLFIHRLVYANPSLELDLKNVIQENKGDFDIVLSSLCS